MRLFTAALSTAVAVALLAGCSGNMSQMTPSGTSTDQTRTTSFAHHGKRVPHWAYPASVDGSKAPPAFRQILTRLTRRSSSSGGFYASQFYGSTIYGYAHKNTSNNPPICTVSPASYVNDVAVDGKGNLVDPDGGTRTIIVYTGPSMCGSEAGSISDPYGQPSDASSPDAVNGTIAVGNIFDTSDTPGSISLCTLSAGCTTNLTNSNMDEVAGIAMDNSGNCWASATNSSGTATLTYFAGCTGAGEATTGFQNSYYGGLDIDKNGNLVSLSAFDSEAYVYSGCNPACTLVGGPFPLAGEAVFGKVTAQSMTYATADFENGRIDVYYYSPTALTSWYNFNNGMSPSLDTDGVAANPRSMQ